MSRIANDVKCQFGKEKNIISSCFFVDFPSYFMPFCFSSLHSLLVFFIATICVVLCFNSLSTESIQTVSFMSLLVVMY